MVCMRNVVVLFLCVCGCASVCERVGVGACGCASVWERVGVGACGCVSICLYITFCHHVHLTPKYKYLRTDSP